MAADLAPEAALIARRGTVDEALPLCTRIGMPRYDATGGRESVRAMLAAGAVWIVEERGVPVAAWSQSDSDGVLWVNAYGGRASVNLIDALQAALEFQQPRAVAFVTRRRALIRKALARGWVLIGHRDSGWVLQRTYT